MSRPKTIRVTSLLQVLQEVEKIQSSASNSLWYRGVGDASYQLLPALRRPHPVGCTTPQTFLPFSLNDTLPQEGM